MAGSWSVEETKALIAIWGQERVQSQLQTVHRNRDVYQRIAMELEENGYIKTWQQCRTKIKNLTQKYRKIRDHNNVSGNNRDNWEYFDEMDAILGTRPTSAPVALVHSGTDDLSQVPSSALNENYDSDETQADDPDLTLVPEDEYSQLVVPDSLQPNESPGHGTSSVGTPTTGNNILATGTPGHNTPPIQTGCGTTCTTSVTTIASTSTSSQGASRRKGLKRKSKETWMANELATILHKLDRDAEERADERERKRLLIEKEEERKRLILEAELEEKRREQERKHEMQMQAMMFGYIQQLQYPTSHNPSLYGSSTRPMSYFPSDDLPPYLPPHSSSDDTH